MEEVLWLAFEIEGQAKKKGIQYSRIGWKCREDLNAEVAGLFMELCRTDQCRPLSSVTGFDVWEGLSNQCS
ncbi:hypothetical protein VNO80_01142 [Phaseolus coccineus]|uniref:Uncharacterized protein n=1 Tax=Phaseolus coccineus TaxID=3886 RepID=A0AAN9P0S5_PHACN